MAVQKPRGKSTSQITCQVCNHKKSIFGECQNCAKIKREEEDKKDKEEFYAKFEDMTPKQQMAWVLEWIRKHRKSFHGHSGFDIQRMVDRGPTSF